MKLWLNQISDGLRIVLFVAVSGHFWEIKPARRRIIHALAWSHGFSVLVALRGLFCLPSCYIIFHLLFGTN